MPTPYIDFDQFAIEALPEPKRIPKFIAWTQGLLSQMTRLNFIFDSFRDGSVATYFDPLVSYSLNQDVIYLYKVYKSLSGGNLGNTPDISPDEWQLVQDIFIGAEERCRYTSGKLCLEWALNRYFYKELDDNGFPGFVQPDDPITPTDSSIFISYIDVEFPSFLVGIDESESSYIGSDGSTGWVTLSEDFTAESSYRFSVNIPALVYASINSNSDIADTIIKEFLGKYLAVGIFYDIVTY